MGEEHDATDVERGWTARGKSSSVQQREHREKTKRVDGTMATGGDNVA